MNTMLIHCLFLGLALALSHSAPPNLDMMMADMGHDHSHDGHDHAHDGHDHAHDGHDHASEGHAHVHDGQDHVHGVTGHDHVHDGHVHHHADHEHVAQIDRCEAVEFDAIVTDASGVPLFFKGDFMWRGFHGPSELINGSYKELIEQHAELGKINAALSMIAADSDKHVFFLLNDKVFSYHDQTLEAGNPKAFSEVFPGIPNHVDAAVECPKGECVRDTVIFFKGCEVFHYETQTKMVKSSHWTHMPNCTSALRWQNNYYCFHGNQFTEFHPVTGSVTGTYPKDARDYFMKCPPNLDMMMADMGHDHSHDGHDHAHDGHDHAHDGHDHASQGHAHVHDGQDHVHGVTGHDHVHDGHVHHHADHEHVAQIDRCEAVEFDAIVPDASGVPLFFKGDFMWRGFHGPSELINGSYKELIEQHAELGKINAALSMIAEDSDKHVFFLLNDKVFSYHDQTLEAGNPKTFSEVFPGIPNHVDAAVECPKGECVRDTVIFFKGCEVFHYETQTKKVKSSHWTHMPNCTSALRWQNNYYCFHGNQFTKFHPVTGSVTGTYPKDARDYFMKCPNFGLLSNHTERERCSHVPLDAIASDGLERAVAFRGNYFLREDETHRDGWHASLVSEAFKEVQSDAEAVFSHARLLYIVKDNKVFAYKSGEQYQLVEGYPKTLQEELGMEGPLDATFVCGDYSILHVIKGQQMFDIELSVSPRAVVHEARLPFPKVDGAMCGPNGIRVFVGAEYFEYKTPKLLAYSRMRPQAHKITLEMFGCDH